MRQRYIPAELLRFSQDWSAFLGYVKRVIKHLESPKFVAHLAHLTPAAAAAVADAVARIRRVSASRTRGLAGAQRTLVGGDSWSGSSGR